MGPSNRVKPYSVRLRNGRLLVLSSNAAFDRDGFTLSHFCTTSVKGNEWCSEIRSWAEAAEHRW